MTTNRRNFLRSFGIGAVGVAGSMRAQGLAGLLQQTGPLRYPYLQNLGSDRVTILWTTLQRGFGAVEYSTNRSFSSFVATRVQEFLPSETGIFPFPYYQHRAELTGLTVDTEYFYRVTLDEENLTPLDQLRFRTAGPGSFRFLAFGDSGQGTLGQSLVAKSMMRENPALVLHTGDIAYPTGTFEEFELNYFDYYRNMMKGVPFFPCPGNHEYETNNASPYLAVHSVPADGVPVRDKGRYYSFDWGNVHFISLDSNASLAEAAKGTGRMLEWLENDLQKTRQLWRVVYFHHPPYAAGPNQNDPILAVVRSRVVPVLERYNVQLVFNGHEHSYQRSLPIRNGVPVEAGVATTYITTGGGGASLYVVYYGPNSAFGLSEYHYVRAEVSGSLMTLQAIRENGDQIDSITLDASGLHARRRP